MKGDIQTVEDLMKILHEKKLSEISYEAENINITIKADLSISTSKTQPIKKECNQNSCESLDINYEDIVSEHIGKFFYKKNDDALAIEVGKHINIGDVIGNVIAVGVTLPVISNFAGVIEELYVKDGDPVDFKKPLIQVKIS